MLRQPPRSGRSASDPPQIRLRDARATLRPVPPSTPPRVTFLGHSTLLVEMDGGRLLTDPVLQERVGPLRRHGPSARASDLGRLDAVLVSHLHWDHLHLPSLRMLAPETLLVVPRGAGPALARRGFRRVAEIEPHELLEVGPLRVRATLAQHGVRAPMAPWADSVGFMIEGSQSLYFAGDTELFPGMADLPRGGERLELAMLPVWGWGPRVGRGHLDPLRAAEALRLLRPRRALPIHWGTLYPVGLPWRRAHALTHAPELFAYHAARLAPEVDVRVLRPGESMVLE